MNTSSVRASLLKRYAWWHYTQCTQRKALLAWRADVRADVKARRAKAAHVLFTMPLMNHGADGGGFTIELLKWSAETQFLRTFVDRCGYEVMPRGQARPPTEMDALVNWFCAGEAPPYKVLAEEHPEWTLLRDMVSLFKFMSSMLPLTSSLQPRDLLQCQLSTSS